MAGTGTDRLIAFAPERPAPGPDGPGGHGRAGAPRGPRWPSGGWSGARVTRGRRRSSAVTPAMHRRRDVALASRGAAGLVLLAAEGRGPGAATDLVLIAADGAPAYELVRVAFRAGRAGVPDPEDRSQCGARDAPQDLRAGPPPRDRAG